MSIETESRAALGEFVALLQEIDQRWSGEEWNLFSADDVVGSHRALMHILEASLTGFFEQDPANPDFRRITTPSRKLTGDNGDAIYFDAPVSNEYSYIVHGNTNGAAYFSITIEEGTSEGHMATGTAGVLKDEDLEIDSNGNFTLYLGGQRRDKNWLSLTPDASRLTTRHYFEDATPAAVEPGKVPSLRIECLDSEVPQPADDSSVAAGIRRVCNVVRSRTLGMPPLANSEPPSFVSLVPNDFPQPVLPGSFGFAAFDAHYSMAPFFLGPDEALVITGRWPDCRFANVCLWNRFQQTLDYANRSVSLNRAQTQLEEDGSFRMIIAHSDPGLPNWLDTESKPMGLVFWRFFLANGEVETPSAKVVKFDELRS